MIINDENVGVPPNGNLGCFWVWLVLIWEGIVVMGNIGKVGIFWYVDNYVDKYTLCGVV